MRRILLGIGVALLVVLVACQSQESKEIIDYHNDYVNNLNSKLEEIEAHTNVLYNEDPTDEEAEEIANELEALGEEIVEYIEKQDPEKEETKEYHTLKSDFVHLFKESIDLDVEMIRGILDDSLDENEVAEVMEESMMKYEESLEKLDEAEDMIEELSEKYDFKEIEE